jgi:hypothetical protein
MKRIIIISLVLIAIGIGFYFGYLKSQNKKGTEVHTAKTDQPIQNKKGMELRTVKTNQPIQLEYQRDPATTSGTTLSRNKVTINITGTVHLEEIIKNLFLNDKTVSWNSYHVEINPEIGKRLYQINLTYPTQEPALNVIERLGKELEFTTYVAETTMSFYRAIRNNKPIAFMVSPQSDSSNSTVTSTKLFKFENYNFDYIFRQYKTYGIFIEDATGVTDKFDGEVMVDKNNPDAMKTDLKTKAGIDLIPFDKTIKLIEIY